MGAGHLDARDPDPLGDQRAPARDDLHALGPQALGGGPAVGGGDAQIRDLDVVPAGAETPDLAARSERRRHLSLDEAHAGAQREEGAGADAEQHHRRDE